MNLYRSFGNLMEAWMNEGARESSSEPGLGSHDEDPQTPSSSHVEAEQRWESLDSGVETSSSDASSSSPADHTEAARGGCLASPSPPPSPTGASLHQRVEQALQRTSSLHLKENREPPTAAAVLRRLPRASPASRRSESFDCRGSGVRPRPGGRPPRRRPASMIVDRLPSQRKLEVRGDTLGESARISLMDQQDLLSVLAGPRWSSLVLAGPRECEQLFMFGWRSCFYTAMLCEAVEELKVRLCCC